MHWSCRSTGACAGAPAPSECCHVLWCCNEGLAASCDRSGALPRQRVRFLVKITACNDPHWAHVQISGSAETLGRTNEIGRVLQLSYDYLQKFGKEKTPAGGARLNLLTRIRYAHDAAKGLIFLHSRKVIHCDLKTSNLLVANDATKTVKICDFSMSRITSVKVNQKQSGGGMVVPTHPEATGSGTPGFISPVRSWAINSMRLLFCTPKPTHRSPWMLVNRKK